MFMEDISQVAIYKMNASVKNYTDCLRKNETGEYLLKISDFKTINTEDINGKFYFNVSGGKIKTQNDIPWLKFINEKLKEKQSFESKNIQPRGIFIYSIIENDKEDFYTMVFGPGAESFINRDKIISDFGLKIAMNTCDPEAIKSIQTSQHESISIQAEKQIHTGAGLSIFDVDYDEEFFKKISGKAKKEYSFISSITGTDRIHLKFDNNNKLSWKKLKEKTQLLNSLYNSKAYQSTEFKAFDNMKYETNSVIIKALDDLLVEKLKNNNFEKISLTVPEIIDSERYTFSYKNNSDNSNSSNKEYEELLLEDLINAHKEIKNIKTIKNWTIYKNDKALETTYRAWNAYQCFVAELDYSDKKYILFNGKWREISENFMENVNKYIREHHIEFDENILNELDNDILIYDEQAKLNKESVYNETIAKNNSNIFLFDKAHIEIGGKSKYEVCDLFTTNKELVQVKRYENGTASISHLFTQARFYAEAFLIDKELRKNLRSFISDSVLQATSINYNKDGNKFTGLIPEERPIENEYTIVLCILTLEHINLHDLPFMTIYSIYQAHKFLTVNFNYQFKIIQRIVKVIKKN